MTWVLSKRWLDALTNKKIIISIPLSVRCRLQYLLGVSLFLNDIYLICFKVER